MNTRIRSVLLAFVLFACGIAMLHPEASAAGKKAALKQGDQISFETSDVDGNEFFSKDLFAANRITVFNIWATWCKPCVAELEDLAKMHTRIRKSDCGMAGLIFDGDTALAECKKLMKEKKVNYPVVQPSGDMPWLEEMNTLPVTLFVDRDGKLLCDPITGADPEKFEEVMTDLLKADRSSGKTATGTAVSAASSGAPSYSPSAPAASSSSSAETTVKDYGDYSVVCTGDACHIEYKTGGDSGAAPAPGTAGTGQAPGGTAGGTGTQAGSGGVPASQREIFVPAEPSGQASGGNAAVSDHPPESSAHAAGMRELYTEAAGESEK